MKYNNTDKIIQERAKYRKLCKCGHSIVIYPFEKKQAKVCSWCGRLIYSNKKDEFKDMLNKMMIKED